MIICDGRVLFVDRKTYLERMIAVEKDYEYVLVLDDVGANLSFYEEMHSNGNNRYATHTELFRYPGKAEFPPTAYLQSSFLTFFEEAYSLDRVDIRKAVRFAVNETASYFTS